jgi:hypothetical protein
MANFGYWQAFSCAGSADIDHDCCAHRHPSKRAAQRCAKALGWRYTMYWAAPPDAEQIALVGALFFPRADQVAGAS